jgi:hypothetical protein
MRSKSGARVHDANAIYLSPSNVLQKPNTHPTETFNTTLLYAIHCQGLAIAIDGSPELPTQTMICYISRTKVNSVHSDRAGDDATRSF